MIASSSVYFQIWDHSLFKGKNYWILGKFSKPKKTRFFKIVYFRGGVTEIQDNN